MPRFRTAQLLLLLAVVSLVAGLFIESITATEADGTTTYAYDSTRVMFNFVPLSFLGLSAVFLLMTKSWQTRAFVIFPVVFGPLLFLNTRSSLQDRLTVGPSELVLPGMGAINRPVHRIAYADIRDVTVARRAGEMRFAKRDGSVVVVPLGDLLHAARERIDSALRSRKITLVEE